MNTALHPDTFPAYIPIDPFSPDPDFRPGAVWTQAKEDYLAGESAPRVCQRYELALSTFRTRMRVEGWRRCDQPDDPAEPRELEAAPATPELVNQAWRAMADALKRGRAYEARAFMRLVHDLRAEVSREEALVKHQAWKAAQAATLDPELHGLHAGLDSAADISPPPPSSSDLIRGPGVPSAHGLQPRQRLPAESSALGSSPRVTNAGVDGWERCDLSPEQELSRDTATSDPDLHCLHSGSHSANPSADIDAAEADMAPVIAEADRLQALARSGKASKAELFTLHTLRTTLRQHRTVCDALRSVDRSMAGG